MYSAPCIAPPYNYFIVVKTNWAGCVGYQECSCTYVYKRSKKCILKWSGWDSCSFHILAAMLSILLTCIMSTVEVMLHLLVLRKCKLLRGVALFYWWYRGTMLSCFTITYFELYSVAKEPLWSLSTVNCEPCPTMWVGEHITHHVSLLQMTYPLNCAALLHWEMTYRAKNGPEISLWLPL